MFTHQIYLKGYSNIAKHVTSLPFSGSNICAEKISINYFQHLENKLDETNEIKGVESSSLQLYIFFSNCIYVVQLKVINEFS